MGLTSAQGLWSCLKPLQQLCPVATLSLLALQHQAWQDLRLVQGQKSLQGPLAVMYRCQHSVMWTAQLSQLPVPFAGAVSCRCCHYVAV